MDRELGPARRAQPDKVELVLCDLVALFLGYGPGSLAQGALQLRRRMDVFHLPARGTDEMMVVP
jgi:hypothetical protein